MSKENESKLTAALRGLHSGLKSELSVSTIGFQPEPEFSPLCFVPVASEQGDGFMPSIIIDRMELGNQVQAMTEATLFLLFYIAMMVRVLINGQGDLVSIPG